MKVSKLSFAAFLFSAGASFFSQGVAGQSSTSYICPQGDLGSVTAIDTSPSNGAISIETTSAGHLCVLAVRDTSASSASDHITKPVARSYDGQVWEISAGFLSDLVPKPTCSGTTCTIEGLPSLGPNETYILTSYFHSGFGEKAEAVRFLEQATFGPTREGIDKVISYGEDRFKKWVEHQINEVPMTSHREYFRRRTVPRQEFPFYAAAPGPKTACERESSWRMYALSDRDGIRSSQSRVSKYMYIKLINGRYVWFVEGIARTTTSYLPDHIESDGTFIEKFELYPTLYNLFYKYSQMKACVGCPVYAIKTTSDGIDRGYVANPKIDLTGIINDPNLVPHTIVDLPPILGQQGSAMIAIDQDEFLDSPYFSQYNKKNDEFYLNDASSVDSSQCANHPNVWIAGYNTPTKLVIQDGTNSILDKNHPDEEFPPLFGRALNEETGEYVYLMFDPKMVLHNNTVDNPMVDGGGYREYETRGYYNCANAPRNFMNEDGCKLSFSEYACKTGEDGWTGTLKNPDKKGVVVCGSVGEVANDLTFGTANAFDLKTESTKKINKDIYLFNEFTEYKNTVWTTLALFDEGQLRQLVAYALYQIIPIGTPDTSASPSAEIWLQYYDIFVRNAFGNYFDVLKQIAFTDVMADWLDYYDNMSLQFNIDKCDLDVKTLEQCENTHPDENFAREIMQLFSVGLWQLNMDGTKKYDDSVPPQPLHAYDSSDIMNMARAWTGLSRAYRHRGNAESAKWGPRVDAMHIEDKFRDIYPKADILGGYIGDRYPLCSELPMKHHLKKGATYRLNGGFANPEMSKDRDEWEGNETLLRLEVTPDSPLYAKLCVAQNGVCTWPGKVVLSEDLDYSSSEAKNGEEYLVDTIRTIRIVLPDQKYLHFEYIRQACVEHFFLGSDAKKIIRGDIGTDNIVDESVCADPRREIATESCCESNWETSSNAADQYSSRFCFYQGERMSYESAVQRCAANNKQQCTPRRHGGGLCNFDLNRDLWYSWTTSSCMTRAKISFDSGLIGRVDYPDADYAGHRNVAKIVNENQKNFVKVAWITNPILPTSAAECDIISSCYSISDGCICDTSVVEAPVFSKSSEILSSSAIFSSLFTASYNDAGSISLGNCGIEGVLVYTTSNSDSCDSFSTETFFGFEDHHGIQRYLKNTLSTVTIVGIEDATFRNIPHFIDMVDSDVRDMYYETDTVIEHFFHHPSHAPFLATRLIQRFGISNPSPGFVKRVASAYVKGEYLGIGSGKYGDLGALISAVLLDTESRSTTLDADPSHGQLREPIIKVTSLLRSMDVHYTSPEGWRKFRRISNIGQSPYGAPSVFSFFLPEYAPSGAIEKAKLVAPESMVMTGKQVTTLLDGLFTTVKMGLVSCYSGFGDTMGACPIEEGDTDDGQGYLTYTIPSGAGVDEALDDLALLLTGGKLSMTNRGIIRSVMNQYYTSDKNKATRIAQQLLLATPEFHTWGSIHSNSGVQRQIEGYTQPPSHSYKSVVFFFMDGGADSYNMIVPTGGCSHKDMYAEYANARGPLALDKATLLPITDSGGNQRCSQFGIHPQFKILQELYNSRDANFYMNVRILSEPLTKADDWITKSKIRLFAHNHMSREQLALDPHDMNPGTGVGGRLLDVLKRNGYQTSGNTVDGSSLLNVGDSYYSNPTSTISAGGISLIDNVSSLPPNEMMNLVKQLNGNGDDSNSLLGDTWSQRLSQSLHEYETALEINEAIQSGAFNMNGYPSKDALDKQFLSVAQYMKSRHLRKVDREVYVVGQGSYDMHGGLETLAGQFLQANNALANFVKELKDQGLWEDTVIVMGSDFGRSISPNSNGGSDHAWGGNYWTLGGGLNGGKILGEYPEHLSEKSDYWVRRGRLIPTTPWDSIWNGIAEWMGVQGDRDLEFVLPNRINFDKCSKMFRGHDLFLDVPYSPCIDDYDGDGVEDSIDRCNDTEYWNGETVNSSGCQDNQPIAPIQAPISAPSTPTTPIQAPISVPTTQTPVSNPVSAPVGSTVEYEAEYATWDTSSQIGTSNTGFTGEGYVNMGGNGSWVEWPTVASRSGTCTLIFRYATTDQRQAMITIDGNNAGIVEFEAAGTTWTEYGEDSLVVADCPSITMTIRLQAITSNGGPNVDSIKVIFAESTSEPSSPSVTTSSPTNSPSMNQSVSPTAIVTNSPTVSKSAQPSNKPTIQKSDLPSQSPVAITSEPSANTNSPTISPVASPTSSPSSPPSIAQVTSAPTTGSAPTGGVSSVPYTFREAEDPSNIISSDAVVSSTNQGYTGSGWVDMGGNGSFVEFTNVNFGGGGSCQLKFRYALKKRQAPIKPCMVSINGVDAGYMTFRATGPGGEYYGYDEVVTTCPSGVFNVRLTGISDYGAPNLDNLAVSPLGVSPLDIAATVYEAEDPVNDIHNGVVKTSYTGYTGSGSVSMATELGTYLEFKNVNFGSGGSCKIDFRYSLPKQSDSIRTCKVEIDGNEVGIVNFSESGPSYNEYTSEMMFIDCPSGVGNVRITSLSSSGGANIDHMLVASVGASPLDIPLTEVYEAEADGNIFFDTAFSDVFAGYGGSGFVGLSNQYSWLEFTGVDFKNGGSCKLEVRYTLKQSKSSPRPCGVSIDGEEIGVLRFDGTGPVWGTWGTDMLVFDCPAGVGNVRVTALSTFRGPNIDSMLLSSLGVAGENPSSGSPSSEPTFSPVTLDSFMPSSRPVVELSNAPTESVTIPPTISLTSIPTSRPSIEVSSKPSSSPSNTSSVKPSSKPTLQNSEYPSQTTTNAPSISLSEKPSNKPTRNMSDMPSLSPTSFPTETLSSKSSAQPSIKKSDLPSQSPVSSPTSSPSSPSSPPSIAQVTSAPTTGSAPTGGVSSVPYTFREAEDPSNIISSDAVVSSTNQGYTGSGWVDMGGNGSFVEFTNVNFGGGGSCQLKFRYALKKRQAPIKPCMVSINGVDAGYMTFRATGPGGEYYGYDEVVTTCPSGVFNVRLTGISDYGAPNLDNLAVSPLGVSPLDIAATVYEAEDPVNDIHNGVVKTSYTGYTGSGSVSMATELGTYLEFKNVNFGSGGSCKIDFRYSLPKQSDSIRTCKVEIDGNEVGIVNFSESGPSYNEYTSEMMFIDCPSGVGNVRITSLSSSGGANIDHMLVASVGASPLDIPLTEVYEAEADGNIFFDTAFSDVFAGYGGSGFVGLSNQYSWLEFTGVDFKNGGSCKLEVRYTLKQSKSSPRPCGVSIDGEEIGVLRFDGTGPVWGTWGTDMLVFDCPAGVGNVRVTALSTFRGPNIDSMKLSSV